MAVYFLRHGESLANIEGVFAGQRNDTPLTDLGLKQAIDAANYLNSLKIDMIISPSLTRARQTANEAAKVIGLDENSIEIDDRIIEYDMGSLTGTPIRKVSSLELVSAKNAENAFAFRDRVLSFLKDHKNDKNIVLVVIHAAVYRMIIAIQKDIDPKEFYSLPPCPNAQATKLDLSWLI